MRLLAAALLLPALLTACGDGGASGEDGLSVVTSFYPLQYLTDRIVDGDASVSTLTAPGAEPHDAELSVAQTAEVVDADVIVYLAGFQPAVDDAAEQSASEHVVDVSDAAELVPLRESLVEDEDEHEGEHPEEEEGEQLDPHFWLDPSRMVPVAEEIADALAEADPENADTYAANLAELQDELTALDDEIARGVVDCRTRTVVVSHNAFQYLGGRYALDFRSIAGLSPESEPSPEHLVELQALIRSEDVTTVFSETLASPQMAETLSSDLGLETAVLDPIEGLSDETADEDYASLMRANLAAIKEANGCQ